MRLNEKLLVYSPTSSYEDVEDEQFFKEISQALIEYRRQYADVLVDFNAIVGKQLDDKVKYIETFGLAGIHLRG